MSFCSDVKYETLKNLNEQKEWKPFLSGLFKTCGELVIRKGNIGLKLTSDQIELNNKVNAILKEQYNSEVTIQFSEEGSGTSLRYKMDFPNSISDKLLKDCYIISENKDFITGVPKAFSTEKDLKSFMKGVFVGCATSGIVLKENNFSGYNLEFHITENELANDVCNVFADFNIITKKIMRSSKNVIYISNIDNICDVLTLIGAKNCMFDLMAEFVERNKKNLAIRQYNCDIANINKTLNASSKQIKAIETIDKTIGILNLPPDLQEIAMLRLANKEESLDNLVILCQNKLSKSGINHRLKRIMEIAKELEN